MKCSPNAILMSFMILLIGFVPSFIHVSFETSSLAVGLILLLICYFVILIKYVPLFNDITKKNIALVAVFTLYNSYCIVSNSGGQSKSLSGMCLIFFMVIIAHMFSKYIYKAGDSIINSAISMAFYVMTLVGISGIFFKLKPEYYSNPKAVFPFSEPSHFALSYGLLSTVFYAINFKSRLRFVPIVTAIFLGIYVQNVTILVYIILILLLELTLSVRTVITVIATVTVIIFYISSSKYFMDRFVMSSDSTNLSALVYMQGLDDTYNALINTNFRGLGIQMLGTQPPSYLASQISIVLGKEGEVNRTDGSFLAAKLVAELGILGILFVAIYIRMFFKSFFYLRTAIRTSRLKEPSVAVLSHAIIFSFSVEMFVRGYGYFSPGIFLFMICVINQSKVKQLLNYRVKCYENRV